mmetsp:Transcript_58608/g.189855  ORF Transcript_58608/g.189855 Transcript_58608/m.189855 type:complete len:163 (+) Transcript_58608:35-523(+)
MLSGRSCCSYFRDGSRQVVAARSQTLFKRALECSWHSHLQDITEFCTQCGALLSGRSCCSYFLQGSRQVVTARSQSPFSESVGMLLAQKFSHGVCNRSTPSVGSMCEWSTVSMATCRTSQSSAHSVVHCSRAAHAPAHRWVICLLLKSYLLLLDQSVVANGL